MNPFLHNRAARHKAFAAAGRKSSRRRDGARRGGRRWRITLLILGLVIGLALGYFLPDYAPGADDALRRALGLKPRRGPAGEPVMKVDVAAPPEPEVFVLPIAAEGDWLTEHLPFGRPRGECADCTEVVREAYVVMHDNTRKNPRWVAWRLDPEDGRPGIERSDDFREDPELPQHGRARLADFRGSGFDRGHVAPAADLRKNANTMSESFFLSNMLPQTPRLNRTEWLQLENAEREWLAARGQLWIIAGPGYEAGAETRTIGPGQVTVPSHCWKIIVDQVEDGSFEALAVWMPNLPQGIPRWPQAQVTIDEIEEWTGLDFFPDLPDGMEDELETRMDEW